MKQKNWLSLGISAPVLLCLLLCSTVVFAQKAAVQKLRFSDGVGYSRVVFDLSATTQHKVFILEDPARLVIDLSNATLQNALTQPQSSNPVIRKIRSAPRNGNDLRVVVDLKEAIKPETFDLQPSGQYAHHRLVVDLYSQHTPQKPDKKTQQSQQLPPANKVKIARKPAVTKPKPPVKSAKPRQSHPAIPTGTRDIVVAIDAGHGGKDPGARGALGTQEKKVALSIAKKLAALIRKQPGMRPVLTREGDYYVGLRERMQKAREAKADLFVSIHADAFRDAKVRGSSVYTLSQNGASDEAAAWLADKENKALVSGLRLEDKGGILAEVLLDLSMSATQEASQEVASYVLTNFKRIGKLHRRKVQKAGFVVLKSPDIPSILIETAFISNPTGEKRLRSPTHQNRIAKSIFQGVYSYFALRPPPGTRMALMTARQ